MDNNIIEEILAEQKELLSIPQTLADVIRIVRDEHASSTELSDVLSKDPALTANLLRIVNSAYYGGDRKIGNVNQAVMMVGVRQVTALALSASFYNLTKDWDSSLDRVKFWRHSLQVAIAARMIAKEAGYKRSEEMFVAGLLHDVGIMILEQSFPDRFKSVWKDLTGCDNPVDCEEEAWGTNHARVGQFLLEQWRLPENICEGVGRHHIVYTIGATDPELLPGQIVSLADSISNLRMSDQSVTAFSRKRENRAIIQRNLGLSDESLNSIEQELFSLTVKEAEFLEMDIGSSNDLLGEANRLLLVQYSVVEKLLRESRQLQQQAAHERLQRVSVESLRTATTAFAGYLKEAADAIAKQVEGTRTLQIHDPSSLLNASSAAILANVSAMRALAKEMEKFAEGDSSLVDGDRFIETLGQRLIPELELNTDQ